MVVEVFLTTFVSQYDNCLISVVLVVLALTIFETQCLKGALTIDEINRFSSVLQRHSPASLEDAYFVVKGLKSLGKEVPSVEVSFVPSMVNQNS